MKHLIALSVLFFISRPTFADLNLCELSFEYGDWNGFIAGTTDVFKNKQIFPLKEEKLKQSLGGFGKYTKVIETTAPETISKITAHVKIEKNQDIGWENHEEWIISGDLLDEHSQVIGGPSIAKVIRSSKSKKYESNEAVPALSFSQKINGTTLKTSISCNNL